MSERGGDNRPVDQRLLLPLLLVILSVFLLVASQTLQAIRDHDTLLEVRGAQEPSVQDGNKLREQVAAIAGQTAQLAADGDNAAKDVVEQMRKQGFTLSPPKP